MLSKSEEDYVKHIFSLEIKLNAEVSTNCIAKKMSAKPSSVTDMLQKLSKKNLVVYKRYKGVLLSQKGKSVALSIIRKHRLWETFLVDKLNFNWDEVHVIAEQLEHIQSDKLTDSLDSYLGYPEFNPHGDAIPNADGECKHIETICLRDMREGDTGVFIGVKDASDSFLKYLRKHKIELSTQITLIYKEEFDNSLCIEINKEKLTISHSVSENIYLKK